MNVHARPRNPSASILNRTAGSMLGLLCLVGTSPWALASPNPAPNAPLLQNQLLDLPGDHVLVRYSPGALARASNVQSWMTALAVDFSQWSKRPTRLAALVIDREQWEAMELRQPYGLPASLGSGRIALPAYGDDSTVARWRLLLGGSLPMSSETAMRGSADEVASLQAADHLGQLEVARQLIPLAGLHPQEPWITELLAHLTVLSAVRRSDPAATTELALYYQQLAAIETGALDAYRNGLEFPQWLAFQARFYRAAEMIANAEKRPMKAITKLEKKKGGRLDAAVLFAAYPDLPALLANPMITAPVQPNYATPD